MGCYMSTPDDKVYVSEGRGQNFAYATASCQGWRREQEDAEACIPDFDDDASLFILCDGHGGSEVAKYTVKHLPNFLKNHPLYAKGDYKSALEQAFIDFDAHLRTDQVMAELTKIAFDGQEKNKNDQTSKDNARSMDSKEGLPVDESGCPENDKEAAGSSSSFTPGSAAGPSSSNGASTIVEDVDTETLRREAQVPIDELINKYADQPEVMSRIQTMRQASLSLNASPVIKSRDDREGEKDPESKNTEASSSTGFMETPAEASSSKCNDGIQTTTTCAPKSTLDILKLAMEGYFDDDDNSDDDSEFDATDESDSDEEDEDEEKDSEDDDTDDDDGDDECDEEQLSANSKNKKLLRKKHRRLANRSPLQDESDSDFDSDSDESDQDDDDAADEDAEAGLDEDEEPEQMGDDGGVIDSGVWIAKELRRQLNQDMKASKVHRPVMDSGCTVVVALAKGNKLYVASAGDSRCIVIMRDGRCNPMSFDHKPEDLVEHRRIQKAGGHVIEGRVNGGLNLSRAFGDFTYKRASLDAKDQMITPCPDVRIMDLDPDQVEYLFLACDGIWNSMRNQQVTKFIRKVGSAVDYNLVDICVAVFKHCLAPGTDGDGTGCDNMTCILARYVSSNERDSSTTNQSDLKATPTNVEDTSNTNNNDTKGENKRLADDDTADGPVDVKRRCLRLLG